LVDLTDRNISLGTLLLRDGSLFFGAILVVNTLSIVLGLTNVFENLSIIVNVLTTILISRLFLNLRQVHMSKDSISGPSEISSIKFATQMLGPLGAPVDPGLSTAGGSLAELNSNGEEIAMSSLPEEEENHVQSDEVEDGPEVLHVAREPLKYGLALE